MSNIDIRNPDNLADKLLETLGGEEVQNENPPDESSIEVSFGNENLMAVFSREEIEVARVAAAEVIRCARAVGQSIYNLVVAAVQFRDRGLCTFLGFESFDDWYSFEGFVPSALNRYMAIYDRLTTEFGIEVDVYQHIDSAKSLGILKLIKAGVNSTEIEESLLMAKQLALEDWILWSEEAVEKHKVGLGVGALVENRPQPDNTSGIESGYYLLAEVPPETIGLASPETNGRLKRVKGLRGVIFHDPSNDLKVVRITD